MKLFLRAGRLLDWTQFSHYIPSISDLRHYLAHGPCQSPGGHFWSDAGGAVRKFRCSHWAS